MVVALRPAKAPRRATPRRPGERSIRASRSAGVTRFRIWASSSARSSSRKGRVSARSSSVRAGVVTATPWCDVTSPPSTVRARWSRSPGRSRRLVPVLVSSTRAGAGGRSRQRPAAEEWLNHAPGPKASNAATSAPPAGSTGCPSAYTPRCRRCSRPDRTHDAIVPRSPPSSRNCRAATTPCCRAARSAAARERCAREPTSRCFAPGLRRASPRCVPAPTCSGALRGLPGASPRCVPAPTSFCALRGPQGASLSSRMPRC